MWLIMDKISNKICSILNLRRVNVKLGKYVWYGWRVEILCWEKVCKLHWDLFQECLEKYFQCLEQTIIVFPIRGVFLRLKDFANRHHSPINVKKSLKFIWLHKKILLAYIFRMFHFFGCCRRGYGIILRSRCGKFICWKVDRFNMVSKLFHQAPEKTMISYFAQL